MREKWKRDDDDDDDGGGGGDGGYDDDGGGGYDGLVLIAHPLGPISHRIFAPSPETSMSVIIVSFNQG